MRRNSAKTRKLERLGCEMKYEGCSKSNAPHFFSHSGIKIAM
jgi:hypothetical protein